MNDGSLRLDELGERRIIEEILRPRYHYSGTPSFGDDCAFVALASELAHGTLVATTDPCPYPMSRSLGIKDYY